jgi:hypothetical protein
MIDFEAQKFKNNYIDTSGFCVNREELEWIVLMILRQIPRSQCVLKTLFGKVLSHLQMKPQGKTREELLQVFIRFLGIMKEQKKIRFVSAKIKVHVGLC